MRRCFFLGAGASAEFGYPTTASILPLIRKSLRQDSLFEGAEIEQLAGRKRITELRQQLDSLLNKLFPGFKDLTDEDLPSVVDVLSLIDHSLRSGTTPARLVPATAMAELRTVLEIAICDVIRPQHRMINRSGTAFGRWLHQATASNPESVSIISTNYDTSIEQFLFPKQIPFTEIPTTVDFGMNWRDPEFARLYPRPVKPNFRFYKLHGSLNWLRCDMCEHIYLNSASDIYVRVLDTKIADYNSCDCGHGKLSLVLVTPSYARDVREPNLVGIWRNAVELLRTSDEWIFVGYSLSPDDINIRSMLIRASQGHGGRPKVKLILDKPKPDILARYRFLFAEVEALGDGFGAYIHQLTQTTH